LLLLTAVLLLAACGRKPTPGASSPTRTSGPALAKVGDEVLTRDGFLILVKGIYGQEVPPTLPREDIERFLDNWVNTELWYQAALRQNVGQDETTQALLRYSDRSSIASMMLRRTMDTATVSDAEVFDYYESHKDDYRVGTKVTIMVLRDAEVADKVVGLLRGGADFARTAREYSVDEPTRGQVIGPFVRDDSTVGLLTLAPELNEAIFALKKDSVSEAVKVPLTAGEAPTFSYVIIKCVDRVPLKSDVKFEAVKRSLARELPALKRKRLMSAITEQLKKESKVQLTPDNFYAGAKR
jgi:hypothetical protein